MYSAPLILVRRKSCGWSPRTERDPETLPALNRELTAALAGIEPSQVLSGMVEFAAAHGYEVTAEEVAEAGGLPLSDGQLSQVAGGAETVHLYLKSH